MKREDLILIDNIKKYRYIVSKDTVINIEPIIETDWLLEPTERDLKCCNKKWYSYKPDCFKEFDINNLLGKTLLDIDVIDNEIIKLYFNDGKVFMMYHSQNCCEDVYLEDISGDLKDIIASPLTLCECVSNQDKLKEEDDNCSFTYTYYKFATVHGYVTLRWFGSSNGYYSEEVNFNINLYDTIKWTEILKEHIQYRSN